MMKRLALCAGVVMVVSIFVEMFSIMFNFKYWVQFAMVSCLTSFAVLAVIGMVYVIKDEW